MGLCAIHPAHHDFFGGLSTISSRKIPDLCSLYWGSWGLSKIFDIQSPLPSFHLGNSFHNYGFLAYGLVANLLGESAMPQLFIFVITFEFLIWTWGIKLINANSKTSFKALINLPAIAMILGVVLKIFHPQTMEQWPAIQVLKSIGSTAVPLALIGLGGLLVNIGMQINFKTDFFSKHLWIVLTFRHLVFPSFCSITLLTFFDHSEFRSILLIQGIMPMALMPLNISSLYGGEQKKLGLCICTSMLLSIVTIPLWLMILKPQIFG
jgi:malate permease and related proteins